MTSKTATLAAPRTGFVQAMLIMGMFYFIFGFVTWLNGALIPFLKLACQLTDSQSLLVTFAFYMAYLFLSLPSSFILEKTGFKNGMAVGLCVMALGSLVFIPAANSRSFGMFLTGLFVQGAGLALLQTAAVNPYVSIIGPIESAAQRISIMGICNKAAGAISPLILSTIVLKNAESLEAQVAVTTDAATKAGLLDTLASRVIGPYIVIAVLLVAFALFISRSSLPNIETAPEEAGTGSTGTKKDWALTRTSGWAYFACSCMWA
ncbi:MFS transporter [Chitinophaga sedimenti]|uniref:MFS transporter n=1 Tax=Chitinophaga sedimenti TaxID=2033606 RepID=UPI0020037FCB|nr:MFS transporter [Chitinophaga sedimenti]MCK7556994.1 MFS transporter [Chitinophaga sedimenti]